MSPSAPYPWSSPQTTLIRVLILSMSLGAPFYSAASSISAGRPLSGDRTITSGGGNFELGFFAPGNKSLKFYVGIWYMKDSSRKPVWVANRETPVHDRSSSELRISGDGNLVLLNEAGNLIWSTKATSKTSKSTAAELLDTGNFILRDGYNSSKVLWQSFDHPTDTWLPGGKLGLNKVTGVAQRLISWKNSEDPAPGIYSLGIDPNGSSQFFLTWNASVRFWSSGDWNGRSYGSIPEMDTPQSVYDFEYVSNDKESYFTYSPKGSELITRSLLDMSGRVKQLMWLDNQWELFWSMPRAPCDVYHLCGPFGVCREENTNCSCLKGFEEASRTDWNLVDFSGGCTRRTPLQCESGAPDQDRFYPVLNMKLPNNSHPLAAAQSAGECESACLSNCSCAAYSYNDGCTVWHHGLFDLQQLPSGAQNGETLHLRLAAMELPTPKPKRRQAIKIAVGAAIGVLSAALTFVWLLIRRHRRRQFPKLNLAVEGSLVPFRYSELRRVTRNFSEKLGQGGFGSVFKGTMPDSTQVAVKKLEGIGQGEKQFRAEVSIIGTIQHVNLVRLRGFCSERSRRLLVYDYMPRGSLDNALFRKTAQVLSWMRRYQIILGIARGLTYLHEKCRDCIIHCDIKPENILLDASLMPKVADFGLAKLVGRDFSRVLTSMRGTIGYLAPEWLSGTAITAKVDVYGFGMMLFEIVSGRKNSVEPEEEKFGFFPVWAARELMKGAVLSLLDPRLEGDADLEELNRVFKVAYWCIQDDEAFRPSMGQVVQILEGVLDVGMPPIPRLLLFLAEDTGDSVFFSNVSSNQSSSRNMPTRDVSARSQRNDGEAHLLQITHEAA